MLMFIFEAITSNKRNKIIGKPQYVGALGNEAAQEGRGHEVIDFHLIVYAF